MSDEDPSADAARDVPRFELSDLDAAAWLCANGLACVSHYRSPRGRLVFVFDNSSRQARPLLEDYRSDPRLAAWARARVRFRALIRDAASADAPPEGG